MKVIDSFDGNYRWLSNFYPSVVALDEELYPTVEHAYQAAKTFDPDVRHTIQITTAPGKAKAFARKQKLRPDWETVKELVMINLLRQKFSNPELRARLIATGDALLVEGNYWHDIYWGVCKGVGKNRLGILLMQVRWEIKSEDSREQNNQTAPKA